jgi:two-component system chemotaxis sensor kinase CheA
MEEAKRSFAVESSELLEEMESCLLRLEKSPGDEEALNSVFRAVHTLKGSAGIVGLDGVQAFTHVVENLLQKIRNEDISISGDLIGLLLECRDHISVLVNETLNGLPSEAALAEDIALLKRLGGYMDGGEGASGGPAAATDNWHISIRFGPDVLRNGMDPISFLSYLARLGEIVSLTTLHDSMPPAPEMDPETCYLGFEIDFKSEADKKAIAGVFEFVEEDSSIQILPPKSRIDSYVKLIQDLPEDTLRLGEILLKGGALARSELENTLRKQEKEDSLAPRNIGDILVEEGMVHRSVLDAAVNKQRAMESTRAAEAKTVRVDTEKLDRIVDLVGEMVIAGAGINQHAQRINDKEMLQSASAMSRLVEEMREKAMSVRMVPLQETFSRFGRVVRDICRDTGKDIGLEVRGGETELDKTVVEKIKDPLMHLVRNAADHGIEMPGERASLGKPARGTLTLNAYQDTGDVVIEVADDGRGVDREGLYNEAVRQGLVAAGRQLSGEEKLRLVFLPGFSTASEVTSISGRGVGMDVVKSNIESLRGAVDLKSREAEGTAVRIRLPLTLAIIEGFLVKVASSHYIVPMGMVVECLELTESARQAAHGRHFVNLRGRILPYVRLRDVFAGDGSTPEHEHILVVQHSGREVGLLVDELDGEIQAVIKSLGRLYRGIRGISAATILGDGTVALVIDVPNLVGQAIENDEARDGTVEPA